ncbi:Hypothetical protein NTJ_05101 [Nesidiocoris tenuis]|uniref:CCHC-type domain-containing protein n=1 Tax=Nesidiocoris tenuis TaxID=355587 RepID=A0ABN7AJ52_9HEMI|nr:Hypothetical protein NTJ_05101 [Nesidiocoris tenuis]
MLSAPKTLEAAISSALQQESAVLRAKGSLSNRRPVYPTTQPAYSARPLCVVRDSPATCWRCDGQGHTMRECPTKVLICWRCDQPGMGFGAVLLRRRETNSGHGSVATAGKSPPIYTQQRCAMVCRLNPSQSLLFMLICYPYLIAFYPD